MDYDARTQIVQIPVSPGAGETCFDIGIIDDNLVESNEEFLVNFQISAGSDAQIGTVGSTCIQIIDDDEGMKDSPSNGYTTGGEDIPIIGAKVV